MEQTSISIKGPFATPPPVTVVSWLHMWGPWAWKVSFSFVIQRVHSWVESLIPFPSSSQHSPPNTLKATQQEGGNFHLSTCLFSSLLWLQSSLNHFPNSILISISFIICDHGQDTVFLALALVKKEEEGEKEEEEEEEGEKEGQSDVRTRWQRMYPSLRNRATKTFQEQGVENLPKCQIVFTQ